MKDLVNTFEEKVISLLLVMMVLLVLIFKECNLSGNPPMSKNLGWGL